MNEQAVEERALSLPEQARAIAIADHEGFAQAGEFLLGVKALRKEVDATFDPIIAANHAAWKTALASKAKVETPIAEAERFVKVGMAGYQQAQERLRRVAEEAARRERERLEREQAAAAAAERGRLEKEAEERRLQAAIEAEAAGDKQAADRIIEAAPDPVFVPPLAPIFAPAPVMEAPRAAGVSFTEIWDGECIDLWALVQAIATSKAPLSLIEPSKQVIRGTARALRGEMKIPGIRVWSEKRVSARLAK